MKQSKEVLVQGDFGKSWFLRFSDCLKSSIGTALTLGKPQTKNLQVNLVLINNALN